MELLHSYVNGNYPVRIYSDGTKVRGVPDEGCKPLFPENIDIKISDKCDAGCAFCHENSTPDGAICHFEHEFLHSLKPGTELAIGGGNVFENPKLRPFLHWCRTKGIIANITVNQEHAVDKFRDNVYLDGELESLMEKRLVHGVGISVSGDIEELEKAISDDRYRSPGFNEDNIVLHVINGIHDVDDLLKLKGKNRKLLILGYKELRRGVSYLSINHEEIKNKQNELRTRLPELFEAFSVVSFDNLAIDQLDVRRHVENWDEFYMGDEGNFTMYIDLVKEEFAMNSTSLKRHKLLPTIEEMFAVVRNEAKEVVQ